MDTHHESARATPLVERCDVLVAGGGPAGIAAALAAARGGASVRLIEAHGQLGGIWTTGLLGWILDDSNKPGIMRLLLDELRARGARQEKTVGGTAVDPEALKLCLEDLLSAAGVRIRLHTRVAAAARDGGNRLAVAISESKSGREAWAAKAFIDCTGDGDLGAQAGCGFDLGRAGSGTMQPMSLICLLAGIDADGVRDCMHGGHLPRHGGSDNLLALLRSRGFDPSYARPILVRIHDNLFVMMANHEYGVSGMDAQDLTDATLRARREQHRLVETLRSCGGPWKDVRLVATGAQIGVREGRRIRGRASVTIADLQEGTQPEDGICPVTFPVDVHSADPNRSKGFSEENGKRMLPYAIPLRALIAADCDGLLMAGRCISGDFLAHSSYRVTGNAVAMGQAAGACAALAAHTGALPHQVPFADVHEALARFGADAPAMNPAATYVSTVRGNSW